MTEITQQRGERLLSEFLKPFTSTFTSFSIKIFIVLPSATGTCASVDTAFSVLPRVFECVLSMAQGCFSVSSYKVLNDGFDSLGGHVLQVKFGASLLSCSL